MVYENARVDMTQLIAWTQVKVPQLYVHAHAQNILNVLTA